jgi:hypothetical protein
LPVWEDFERRKNLRSCVNFRLMNVVDKSEFLYS